MSKQLAKVTHSGKWKIESDPILEIMCYVTDNKRRLMSQKGTSKFMGLKGSGSNALTDNLGAKVLAPFFTQELKDWVKKVKSGEVDKVKVRHGLELVPLDGELFVDICKAYITAQKSGVFENMANGLIYSNIADKLFIAMSAFAKVGIVAIIDEITEYQFDREKDELQKLLAIYVQKEYIPWTKTFSEEYYTEICRLRGWVYKGKPKNHFIGKLTNKLIYDVLPENVLEEIKKYNPLISKGNKTYRRHRHHQFLTETVGVPHLVKHLVAVITLMKACETWSEFEILFNRLFYQIKDEDPVGKVDDFDQK